MDVLRGVCVCACFLGTVFSIAESMVPSEKFMGMIKTVFSLIFVLVIVSPFVKGDIDLPEFDIETGVVRDFGNITEIRLNERINENICEELGRVLSENGIEPVNISVLTNISVEGSISIIKAEIVLSHESEKSAALQIARKALGDTEIVITTMEREDDNAAGN